MDTIEGKGREHGLMTYIYIIGIPDPHGFIK